MKKIIFLSLTLSLVLTGCSFQNNKTSPQVIKSNIKVEQTAGDGKKITMSNPSFFAFNSNRGLEQCNELLGSEAEQHYNYCVGYFAEVKGDMSICKLKTIKGGGFGDNMPESVKQEQVNIQIEDCIKGVYKYAALSKNYSLLSLCGQQDSTLKKSKCYIAFRNNEIYEPCTVKYATDYSPDAASKWDVCAKEHDTICPRITNSEERTICENAYKYE